MIACNLHTHTVFSDGRDSAERMVEEALAKGFYTLGFSDHGYSPWDDGCMPRESERKYREEIRRLAKLYEGRIELPLGYERDATTPETDITPYDYVIESVHFLSKDGEHRPIDYTPEKLESAVNDLYGGDWYAMTGDYFDSVCDSITGDRGEIVGHIGLPAKFNEKHPRFDETDPRYVGKALETLKYVTELNKIAEVNTGAISRGWRTVPYPTPELLRAFAGMGGRVMLSSDCHRADWIDWAFADTAELLRASGFRTVWVWREGALREETL